MKKRVISAFLCLVMLVCLLNTVAFASDLPFNDVKTSAWYYSDVKTAYEGGLINGKSATTFEPDSFLTYAETVKLAACMHQKSMTGQVTLTSGKPWYQSYVDYCKLNGIISKDYKWEAKATRAGYIEIFANALPDYSLKEINTIDDNAIPDVPMSHPQAEAIYKLYRAGILCGSDDKYSCNPDSNIKRSEVAAILTRMMNADARIKFEITSNELKIKTQPQNITAVSGDIVEFTLEVSGGTKPYVYVWQSYSSESGKWSNILQSEIACPNGNTLTVRANETTAAYKFRCVVTDANYNTITSESVKIDMSASKLVIKTQPKSVIAASGNIVEFSVEVSGGTKPYNYVWQCYNSAYDRWDNVRATDSILPNGETMLVLVNESTANKLFRCYIQDAKEVYVISDTVKITMTATELKITSQPKTVTVVGWENATYSVSVSGGTKPYHYQWYWNGYEFYSEDSDKTTSSLILTSQQYDHCDTISCEITDANGNMVTTETVYLRLSLRIAIQPENQYTVEGSQVEISVMVTGGTAPYTFRWQSLCQGVWEDLTTGEDCWPDEDTLVLIASRYTWTGNEDIRCIITDADGNSVISDVVSVTVRSKGTGVR